MRKRFFAGLLAFMMMLSVIPATEVSAASVSGNNAPTVSGPNVDDGQDANAGEPAPQADEEFVEVSTYKQLVDALDSGAAKVKMTADITATAAQSSGYGKAGAVLLEAGDVLDGDNHKLTINGADTTWDCAVAMKGGEVRNLTITGGFRGVFMPGAVADVVIDNCILEDVTYTFNSDAGSKDYSVTIKNTTLKGWTSFSNAHKSVTFENCTFSEGRGYAFCRPYQPATFNNCKFNEGFEVDTTQVAENALQFNNCTYNGQVLSSENNDMFFAGGLVMIDGTSTDVTHYVAEVGGTKYETLKDAVANATGTITLIDTAEVSETIVIDGGKTVTIALNENGSTISGSADPLFKVTDGTLEFTGSGTILAEKDAIRLHGNEVKGGDAKTARVVIGKEVAVMSEKANCIYLRGNGAVADVYGYIESSSIEYAAIQGNGTVNDSVDYGHTVLNIYSTASVISKNDVAIYHPQSGKVNVKESNEYAATIKGVTGIEMRAGELTVEGGYIASTGAFAANNNGNGSTVKGAAIVVSQHSTDIPTKVVIKNGAIEAVNSNGKAFYEADLHNQNPYGVEVEIKGGDFTGAVEFVDLTNKKVISGGLFDREVSAAYVANGYEAVQGGDNWIVGKHEPKLVEEESATCFKEGRKAHYQCETCGRVYSDETGSVEIDLKDYAIPMVGHNFVDGVCSYGCGTTGEINVSTHQGMTQVEVSNTITEENKENAFHVGASMIAPEGVDEAVEKICEEYQNDKELAEDAKKALENKGIEVSEGETVEVVVVTYLETEVKDADFSALEKEDTPVVTVEINLYYDLVVTTDKTDKNKLNANNSVTLSKRNKIENPESVTLNFCLPADLLDAEALKAAGKVLYLKHPKGNGVIRYHEATLIDGKEWDSITFVNDHGFSEFTLMVGDKVPADLIPTTSGKGESEKAPGKEEVKKDPIEVHIAEPITPPPATVAPAPTGDSANIVGLSLTMIVCAAAIVLFARRRVNK